ncbi:transglycosylase domain-containing protein [Bartonella sp. HY038]|uniref:transglycosylase domain-containing protein n=1 Tax=Bartonella sp. HY038 TaxID=2759660 RepID=UPI0015F864F2|nr:transglycosylase domain-containing protein [Bartonella sp. HY038]
MHISEDDRVIKPTTKKSKKSKNSSGQSSSSKRRKSKKQRSFFGRLFYWSFVLGLWGIIFLGAYITYVWLSMPQLSTWTIPNRPPNVRIVARGGELIANRGTTGGEAVTLKNMSPWIGKAVVAIEDRRFNSHYGVDPVGIARAVYTNVTNGRGKQGGSTLTQQLAKNLFLSSERTLDRKVREALIALWLEKKLNKDQILELYLNRVYLGSGAFGVEAASRRYFNKSAKDVTLLEAATLAGLLKAPSSLSPARNPEAAYARAKLVLAAMRQEDMINDTQLQIALAEPMVKAASYWSGGENYAADYVVSQLPFLIGEADRDIIVETTLDYGFEKAAEKAINTQLSTSGKKNNVSQAALVSIDKSGAIRALIGGANYADSQFNRATDARRQPGSTFKPFVYLAALEQGRTPNSVRNDAPVKIGKWTPRNAGGKYMGQVTLTTALSHSLNSVAAQLIMEVGTDAVIETAHRLGVHSGLNDNASIALGTSEVSLIEMTGAFVPLSNGGYKPQIHIIRRITDTKGKVLYDIGELSGSRVIDPQIVGMMNAMLEQTILTGTAKRANIGRPAAGKTGTSQNSRDAWFIGYTADYVTGVWFGNDDGKPMKGVSGGGLPVNVWKDYMGAAEKNMPIRDLLASYQIENAIPGGNDLLPDDDNTPSPYNENGYHYGDSDDNFPPPPPAVNPQANQNVEIKNKSLMEILRTE